MLGSSHPTNRMATNREACFVAPSPEVCDRLLADPKRTRGRARGPLSALLGVWRTPRRLGFDDGFSDREMTTTADQIRDLFFSTPRQSRTTVYRLLARLIRRPGAEEPDHEYVANTAVDRHHRGGRYAPAGLIEYLDAGGPVVPVALARGTRQTSATAGRGAI